MYLTVSAVLAAGLSGCGSSRHATARRGGAQSVHVTKGGGAATGSQRIEVSGSLPDATRRLLEEAGR